MLLKKKNLLLVSRCLRKIQLLFLQSAVCVGRRSLPKNPEQRGQERESSVCKCSLLHHEVAQPRSHWIFCTCTERMICLKKCFFRGKISLQPECALSTLCDFWISFLLMAAGGSWCIFSHGKIFSLRLGSLQAGTSSGIQVCKKKSRGRSSLSVPGWRKMSVSHFSSIIPQFPPWCVVSPQIQFRTLGELRGPGCRARGSLGLEHPFLSSWWVWAV